MNEADVVRVGDTVIWRGSWGNDAPKQAVIESMELCKREREKYGIPVNEAYWSDKNRLCVSLSNGSWAYGYQIEAVKS